MNLPQHLSWNNFKASVLVKGQKRVHRVAASPLIDIFADGEGNRIGIWLESPADTQVPTELSRLSSIAARTVSHEGKSVLEIATSVPSLQHQFYHFATSVSERILVDKIDAVEAALLEVKCFTELLDQKSILGIEKQLGLLGELIFLEHLALKDASRALEAWIGPTGEPHDFRFQSMEFEVKTTTSARRVHTISNLDQVVPSTGCSLFFVSIKLGPPGAASGFSLAEKINSLKLLFSTSSHLADRFVAKLEALGLRESDLVHYTRNFILRSPFALIAVDGRFPAICRETIDGVMGPQASRVESVQYEVNLEGLEFANDAMELFDTL